MTNMQSFLDDITWLLSCDVIFGCRYSSVQFILKALVSDAQELKIVGCKMPKAFKTVPQKALHELEEFMAQQGAFIYQHIEYVVPQHNLERCQLHLLRQISAQNIMEAYDFVHQHWDGWSSEHKYYAQNSVLGQCELKTMLAPHVKAWKELSETLQQRNQSGFSHVRRPCGFWTALFWTRLFRYATEAKRPVYLSISQCLVQVSHLQAPWICFFIVWSSSQHLLGDGKKVVDWANHAECATAVLSIVNKDERWWQYYAWMEANKGDITMLLDAAEWLQMSAMDRFWNVERRKDAIRAAKEGWDEYWHRSHAENV